MQKVSPVILGLESGGEFCDSDYQLRNQIYPIYCAKLASDRRNYRLTRLLARSVDLARLGRSYCSMAWRTTGSSASFLIRSVAMSAASGLTRPLKNAACKSSCPPGRAAFSLQA